MKIKINQLLAVCLWFCCVGRAIATQIDPVKTDDEINDLSIAGNRLDLGTTVNNESAMAMHYHESGTNYVISLDVSNGQAAFLWRDNMINGAVNKMTLDGANVLTLHSSSQANVITLDPNAAVIGLRNGQIDFGDGVILDKRGVSYLQQQLEPTRVTLGNSGIMFRAGNGSASGSFIIGNVNAQGPNSLALGDGAYTGPNAYNSFAGGYFTKTLQANAVAFGDNSIANGWNAVAIGNATRVEQSNAVALGTQTVVSGNGWDSLAGGYASEVTEAHSIAFGDHAMAHGWNGMAVGYYTETQKGSSVALGSYTKALDNNAFAGGEYTAAKGWNAIALGYRTEATGFHSLAAGCNTVARGFSQTVIGQYNVAKGNSRAWVASNTEPVFIVGNGTGEQSRSNAFVVNKDGSVLMKPQGDLPMGNFQSGQQP
jgi:hypothetical protein